MDPRARVGRRLVGDSSRRSRRLVWPIFEAVAFTSAFLLLAPLWFSIRVLGSLCGFGDPLQTGTASACQSAMATSSSVAWGVTASLAGLLVIATFRRLAAGGRAGRAILSIVLAVEILAIAPIAVVYAASAL